MGMQYNAYILDWTMNDYETLKKKLNAHGFDFVHERNKSHIRVHVPFSRWEEFGEMVRAHLNTPYSYVDIQYPEKRKTILVFGERIESISNAQENEAARKWAIARGLPPAQADWETSY
jgi:hypothetical protein